MRKVFVLFAVVMLMLLSCCKGGNKARMVAYEFTYKGHTYINFNDRQHAYSTQVVHSPDCKKCLDMFD